MFIGIASFAGGLATNRGITLLRHSYASGCICVAMFMAFGCVFAVSKEMKRAGISFGREFTETNEEGQTKVHRVGLCTGMAAAMFWQSGVCFCLSVVAVSLDYWVQIDRYHFGLFDLSGQGMLLTMLESYPL